MRNLFTCLVLAVTLATACGDNDDESNVISMNVSEKTLYFNDEYQIEATSKTKIIYTVENEYHAKVSETGLVTARYVGETNILLSNGEDSKIFKVIVEPKSNLYPEPDVKFGDSKSAIIEKFGQPDFETLSGIGYANYSNLAPILMFRFDESNKMKSYAVVTMVEFTHSSELADFLWERYKLVIDDGIPVFINGLNFNTATMSITSSSYNFSHMTVIYLPITTDYTSVANEFDELLEQLQ
jgi:hypothetical protein